MRHAGSIYLMVVGLLLIAAGGSFFWLMWRSFDRASGQRDWEEVACHVLEARVEERKIGVDVPTDYRFGVLYGYRFEDEGRTSERYSLRGSSWSKSRERAEALVQKFPSGSAQVCFVNPEDPDFAVLKRDSKAPGYSIWFPLIFVVGGLGVIVGAVRSMVRTGSQ